MLHLFARAYGPLDDKVIMGRMVSQDWKIKIQHGDMEIAALLELQYSYIPRKCLRSSQIYI